MLTALPAGRIALAVSGGSDSLAMLHLVRSQRPASEIIVLTVDHGLRSESHAEAEKVAHWCAALGVEQHILAWHGAKPGTGIQAKARSARYDVMTGWCSDHGVPVLLTAHTMDDQAETVVMRAARTNSPKSIAGIWPETLWNGIRILRPLLSMRREALRGVLRASGTQWIDDPSNENPKFERVRVRNVLAASEIVTLAKRADQARQDALALRAAANVVTRGIAVSDFGHVTVPRTVLRGLQRDLAAEILLWTIQTTGGGHNVDPDPLFVLVEKVQAAANFRSTLGGALIAARKGEVLVGREFGRISDQPVVIGPGGGLVWDGRFQVSAPSGSSVRPAGARCPRVAKHIPAFVLAALPAVTLPGGHMVLPHFTGQIGVSVTLGERFGR